MEEESKMGAIWAKLALATVLVVAATGGFWAPAAGANTGDVLADIQAPGSGVAFDGQALCYTDTAGLVLNAVTPTGAQAAPDVAITGATGVQALTYDLTRNVFWGVDSTGLTVYTVNKSGLALLQFAINPATDLPGLCGSLTGCSTTIDGLAYDATDDSLWFLPNGSTRIYHIDTGGNPLGYVDVSSLGCTRATGIASDSDSLYATACGRVIRAAKTDTGTSSVASSFAAPSLTSGDVECDDVTFPNADAEWIRDTVDGHLRAEQIPAGTCV